MPAFSQSSATGISSKVRSGTSSRTASSRAILVLAYFFSLSGIVDSCIKIDTSTKIDRSLKSQEENLEKMKKLLKNANFQVIGRDSGEMWKKRGNKLKMMHIKCGSSRCRRTSRQSLIFLSLEPVSQEFFREPIHRKINRHAGQKARSDTEPRNKLQ